MAPPSERTYASVVPLVASSPDAQAAPDLALIVAVAKNGTIGANNALPWRLPEDLRRFRALTSGHAVIMGRRTWESLSGPLPDRQNIVVTRDRAFRAGGAEVVHSLDEALTRVAMPPPAFCIGGAELYALAMPRAARLYVTEIERDFPGDTQLPPLDRDDWVEVAREPRAAQDPGGPAYAFVTYARARRGVPPVG